MDNSSKDLVFSKENDEVANENEMVKKIFKIKFDGDKVSDGEMSIEILSKTLLALNALIQEANAIANNNDFNVVLKISSDIKKGSFEIQLVTSVWQEIKGLFTSETVTALLNIKQAIGIGSEYGLLPTMKKVAGRNVVEEETPDGTILRIDEKEGIIISPKAYKLYQSPEARKALQTIIDETIGHEGIETLSITDGNKDEILLKKSESHFFKAPNQEETPLGDITYEKYVNCLQISFRDDLVWKFKDDDGGSFNAKIEDEEFLSKIKSGDIAFSATDTFKVRIKESQTRTSSGSVQTRRHILKVISTDSQMRLYES